MSAYIACPFCGAPNGVPHKAGCQNTHRPKPIKPAEHTSSMGSRSVYDNDICRYCGAAPGTLHLPNCAFVLEQQLVNQNSDGVTIGGHCPFCLAKVGEQHSEDCLRYTTPTAESHTIEEYVAHISSKDYIKENQPLTAPKDDNLKPDWSVFPFDEADSVRKVFEYGAKKYGKPFTYRRGNGVEESRLWAATFRHLLQIQKGESIDPESLCYHWSHVAANALMAIATLKKQRNVKD